MAEKTVLPPLVMFVGISEVTRFSPHFVINVGGVQKAKHGDWVRLMIRFPHRCEFCNAPDGRNCRKEGTTDHEILSGKIVSVNSALAKIRILSNPAQTALHSLSYGDDVSVLAHYILDYIELSPARVADEEYLLTGIPPEAKPIFRKDEILPGEAPRPLYDGAAEDRKLREAIHYKPALAPSLAVANRAGKRYWLRNGAVATVWSERGEVFLGRTDDGQDLEWNRAGQNADREFDIVKDPAVSEVLP